MVTQLIHNFEECCNAFKEAAKQSKALTLALPCGAVHYMGLLYIHTMLQEAEKLYPEVQYTFLCDCGSDASLAQEALQMGFPLVGYSGASAIAAKLQDIATHYCGCIARSQGS